MAMMVTLKNKKVVLRPPKIPELDRRAKESDRISAVKEFLEWLMESWAVKKEAAMKDDSWELTIRDIHPREVISEFFELNEPKAEKERRLILVHQRILNAQTKIEKKLKKKLPNSYDRQLLLYEQLLEVEKKERKELGV